MQWKGYLTIAIMMTGGILLRHSANPWRSYICCDWRALLQASVNYYARLGQLSFGKGRVSSG